MAAGLWTITELQQNAQGATDGEVFTWTADPDAMPTPKGGARCAPKSPWNLSGMVQHKRTDYPTAVQPSVQVLGPRRKPFTLEGALDDRYNFPGFAVGEMRRLEAMIFRGNLCRVAFQDQSFVGLFIDYDFPYRRAWQIGYSLQFDVHGRTEDFDLTNRSPSTALSSSSLFGDVDTAIQAALDFDALAPRTLIGSTAATDATMALANMANLVDQLGASVDNRDVTPPENPVDGFSRLATQFRAVGGAASDLLVAFTSKRADLELSVQTVIGVLDFETWSRSLRYAARVALGSARIGDLTCTARARPDVTRLYRPRAGEHLYAIAREQLGTPHAWRLIYDRNNLVSVTMAGTEILVIPKREQV